MMMKHEAYKKRFSEKSEKRFLFKARLRTIKMECLINIPFLLHLPLLPDPLIFLPHA